MYAIIATGGKQYKVSEGDIIRVEKLGAADGSEYTFDQVLAVGGNDFKVGAPTVAGQGKDWLSQEEWSQTAVHIS